MNAIDLRRFGRPTDTIVQWFHRFLGQTPPSTPLHTDRSLQESDDDEDLDEDQKKDLERVSIIIPTNSTQREIIDLVDSFDGKIDTEYSISLLLNHQKTYLLSKLFI